MPRAPLLSTGPLEPDSAPRGEGIPMFLDALRATIEGGAKLEEETVQVRRLAAETTRCRANFVWPMGWRYRSHGRQC